MPLHIRFDGVLTTPKHRAIFAAWLGGKAMQFIQTIWKALIPLFVTALGAGAEAVGAPTPPVGTAEWIGGAIISFFVWVVPNKKAG